MADVSQIKLPNNTTYTVKDAYKSGIYTVIGTQTAATGAWTGVLHGVSALYDGLTIMYYLPYAGSGNATLNLTLDSGSTTGAVNCYYHTSRLTTHYGKGSNIVMTYWSAGSIKIDGTATTDNRWIANANYDSNDTAYYVRTIYNRFKVGANKVFPYTIILQCSDGRWESIVTSSSTGTSKARNTHGFRLGQIALMYADATYNENATIGDYNVWEHYTNVIDHRFSFNTANNSTSGTTANKPVYLVGAINSSDGLFYLDTTWWTQTLPSTADGKLYIYLGDAYDYYRMTFRIHHPVYCYTNGKIRQFAQDAATVNGLTVQTAVPSGAVFTDTNTKVTQTNTTTTADYRILFSDTADDTTRTEGARKHSSLKYNPGTSTLTAKNLTASAEIFGGTIYTNELRTNTGDKPLIEYDGTSVNFGGLVQSAIVSTAYGIGNGQYVHTYSLSPTSNGTVTFSTSYGAFLALGFVQGIGGVGVLVKLQNGTIGSVRDLFTNTAFSNSYLTFTASSSTVTIKVTAAGYSYLTVFKSY